MTIEQFVERSGGPENAASRVFVSARTIDRWLKKKSKPRGLVLSLLEKLGVTIDAPIKRGSRRVSLSRFVKLAGSQTKAAMLIGVSRNQLIMWIDGKSTPASASISRLDDLGIIIP
jgi:DNA-binding transcriptional regulator YiaG